MKTRTLLLFFSIIWVGLNAQQINVGIEKSAGDCLLQSNCESNTVCFDLTVEIDEPGWELRSYNIWVSYPSPPLFTYNSDNACVTQNGGDTDNNQEGQYRVGGVNGSYMLEEGVNNTFHSICFGYADNPQIEDSLISVGGTAKVYGFPFESTITVRNTQTGETVGFSITSVSSAPIRLDHKHLMDVDNGWSGISTYMEPDLTNIETIMSPALDDLVLMYNLTEGIYSPGNNINTIVNWNYKSGYIVKVTDDITLNICGTKPQNKSINLMSGWNVIPVLDDANVPVGDVFDALGENLVIVKEIAGYRMYYPAYGITSLNSLESGKAYFVRVNEACQITFPESTDKNPSDNQTWYFEQVSPWGPVYKTPESHVFCFSDESTGKFETGDLIGAFDQQGRCTGIMEILDSKQAFAVSVFGDDETTSEKDGMNESEPVAFTLFRTSTGEMLNLNLAFAENSPCEGNFISKGISIVKDVLISSTGTGINNYLSGVDMQVFPNPTDGETRAKLTGDVKIDGTMIITDSRGRMLSKKEHTHQRGVSFGTFDFSAYSPGVYYLRYYSDNYINIQKIVVK